MTPDSEIPRQIRLSIPDLPGSFSGRLYYFIGPGLGDTVNGFRILHEVAMRYPQSHSVVYLDPRWKSLYPLIPELSSAEVRYYSEASSAESLHQPSQSFHRTLEAIIDQMVNECRQAQAHIAMAAFKLPDRLPKKETSLAMSARAIGLRLPSDSERPYCPLSEEVLQQAGEFLRSNGLREGSYLAVAPSTWLHKMWPSASWAALCASMHREFGLDALILGIDGFQELEGPHIKRAMNLPLGIVSALIARARCYIGLDSGLTHLAASSDVPIVTLNPQGEFPPFCVEPHSPYRWTHLSPLVYGRQEITAESVAGLVRIALQTPLSARCPLCHKGGYVLEVLERTVLMLCRCGLLYRLPGKECAPAEPAGYDGNAWTLPSTISGLQTLLDRLTERRRTMKPGESEVVDLRFEHWDPVDVLPQDIVTRNDRSELWWTWDAAFELIASCGWAAVESRLRPLPCSRGPRFSVLLKAVPASSQPPDVRLAMPWGRRVLHVRRSFYGRWLSWGTFRKSEELEGMGWAAARTGDTSNARALSLLAFKLRPCWKTASRLSRVWSMPDSYSDQA